jgi:hypothetical protein
LSARHEASHGNKADGGNGITQRNGGTQNPDQLVLCFSFV